MKNDEVINHVDDVILLLSNFRYIRLWINSQHALLLLNACVLFGNCRLTERTVIFLLTIQVLDGQQKDYCTFCPASISRLNTKVLEKQSILNIHPEMDVLEIQKLKNNKWKETQRTSQFLKPSLNKEILTHLHGKKNLKKMKNSKQEDRYIDESLVKLNKVFNINKSRK